MLLLTLEKVVEVLNERDEVVNQFDRILRCLRRLQHGLVAAHRTGRLLLFSSEQTRHIAYQGSAGGRLLRLLRLLDILRGKGHLVDTCVELCSQLIAERIHTVQADELSEYGHGESLEDIFVKTDCQLICLQFRHFKSVVAG